MNPKDQSAPRPKGYKRIRLTVSLILTIALTSLPLMSAAQAIHAPVGKEAADQLENISLEEKKVMTELFELSSEIERINTEIVKIEVEIKTINDQITEKQKLIAIQATYFETVKTSLADVLRSQQRAGIGSNLEIVLNSKNLKDLLQRLNLLRDLSRNTAALMSRIETVRSQLKSEQQALTDLLLERKLQQAALTAAYDSKSLARNELEAYLESLASEKAYYEDYLQTLDRLWVSFKPLFAKTVRILSEILESGEAPEDTVEVTISMFQARGRITEQKLNAITTLRADLPEIRFKLYKDRVTCEFPNEKVLLSGKFIRLDGKTFEYDVTSGTFYGIPMSSSAVTDLLSKGTLTFDLTKTIGRSTLRSIEHLNGAIELLIDISLY